MNLQDDFRSWARWLLWSARMAGFSHRAAKARTCFIMRTKFTREQTERVAAAEKPLGTVVFGIANRMLRQTDPNRWRK